MPSSKTHGCYVQFSPSGSCGPGPSFLQVCSCHEPLPHCSAVVKSNDEVRLLLGLLPEGGIFELV